MLEHNTNCGESADINMIQIPIKHSKMTDCSSDLLLRTAQVLRGVYNCTLVPLVTFAT